MGKSLNILKKYFSFTSKKQQKKGYQEIKVQDKPDYEMLEYMLERRMMARQFDWMLKHHFGNNNIHWVDCP